MDNLEKIEKLEKIQNNLIKKIKEALFGLKYNFIDIYFFMGLTTFYINHNINMVIFTLLGVLYMLISERLFNKK